jgi:hypothetical protein
VLDDDEAVFSVLEGGDEEAADETEDEDVALHDGIVKYNGDGEEVVSPRKNSRPIPVTFSISVPPAIPSRTAAPARVGETFGCVVVCAAMPSWFRLKMKLDPKANGRVRSSWRL